MYKKSDFQEKLDEKNFESNRYTDQAAAYLEIFGGAKNIVKVNNCATRLRVTVKDKDLVGDDNLFREGGAKGIVRSGSAFQIIVGLDVPQVREQFEKLMEIDN